MDVLNAILLQFQFASEKWAIDLINILEPSIFAYLKLGILLTFLSLMFNQALMFATLLRATLYLGLCHFVFLEGWVIVRDLFFGTSHLSQRMGAPAANPSAILALGLYVADPLLKSIASQGITGFLWHPSTVLFSLAGVAILLAYCLLALVQFSLHLFGSILIGSAPFFLLFLPLPVLNSISNRWIQLVGGTIAASFVVGLIAGIMQDLSGGIADFYRTSFADAAAGGVTLTAGDYAIPLLTACVMGVAFWQIPLKFFAVGQGVMSDLMAGIGAFAMGGQAVASTAGTIPSSGSGSSSPSVSGNSGGGSIANSSGGDWGGGGLAPAKAPATSGWGRP